MVCIGYALLRVCGGRGVGGRKKVSDTLSPSPPPPPPLKITFRAAARRKRLLTTKNIFFYGGVGGKEFRAGTISVLEQELYPTSAPFSRLWRIGKMWEFIAPNLTTTNCVLY